MKNLHYGHCLIGVALASVLLVALGVSTGTLAIVAVAVACPLMMFVMMRTMMNDNERSSGPIDEEPFVDHGRPR